MGSDAKQKYEKVLDHLTEARDLLVGLQHDDRDYDAGRYARMIQEIISCDNDGAGIEPFTNSMS